MQQEQKNCMFCSDVAANLVIKVKSEMDQTEEEINICSLCAESFGYQANAPQEVNQPFFQKLIEENNKRKQQ